MSGLQFVLDDLSNADLEALRLSAQVMGHKAVVDDHPLVRDFFVGLEQAFRDGIEARVAGRVAHSIQPDLSSLAADDDRRLVSEYLGLLAANTRLSLAVRGVARQLQTALSR